MAERKSVGDMVREFHEVYDAYIGQKVEFPEEHLEMRLALIKEEYADEFIPAVEERDLVGTIDALGDLVYVLYGMALSMGVDLDDVIAEIHRSNMTKLGEDGKPIYRDDWKVLKGPNYEAPNIAKVIGL